MTLSDVQELIRQHGIEFIRFEQTDTHGIARSKTIPRAHFEHFATQGLNFLMGQLGFDVQAGVAPGTGYLEEIGFPDSRLFPDFDTFRVLPWADATARVICEPYFYDGRPAMAHPRLIARQLLDDLADMGYTLRSGYEYEFYLVNRETREPPFPGIQIFATLRNNFDESLVYQILREMSTVGVDIITANAEYGPGQMEINFAPADGMAAADDAFTFKNGVKEITQRNGYMTTFMTKPYVDQSASGCHYHQSLFDIDTGQNVFDDPDGADGLSDVCRQFLAGQLAHAPAMCALVAPTVNCYKRYKLYSFAPTNATWGHENRTVGIRVKGTRGEGTHIENRTPGAASNPYLVMAACLAAGIDGIRRELAPPDPIDGMAYGLNHVVDLPQTLDVALEALERDEVMIQALGDEFVKLFLAVKRHEIGKAREACGDDYGTTAFNERVDPWEVAEYFEFL